MPEVDDPFGGSATNKSGGNYELIEADNYPGHLVAMIDLGTHDDEYQGQARPDQRSFVLGFELSGEKLKDGTTPVLAEVVSVYLNNDGQFVYSAKNKLRKILESMRGQAYGETEDVKPLAALGKPCMVSVKHTTTRKGKAIAVIDSVSKPGRGTTVPPIVHAPIFYGIKTVDVPNLDHLPFVYAGSPKKMQSVADVIAQSKEKSGDTEQHMAARPAAPTEATPPSIPGREPGDDSQDDDDKPPF